MAVDAGGCSRISHDWSGHGSVTLGQPFVTGNSGCCCRSCASEAGKAASSRAARDVPPQPVVHPQPADSPPAEPRQAAEPQTLEQGESPTLEVQEEASVQLTIVSMSGETLLTTKIPSESKVGEIRIAVEKQMPTKVVQQLAFERACLKDSQTLVEVGILSNSTLQVIFGEPLHAGFEHKQYFPPYSARSKVTVAPGSLDDLRKEFQARSGGKCSQITDISQAPAEKLLPRLAADYCGAVGERYGKALARNQENAERLKSLMTNRPRLLTSHTKDLRPAPKPVVKSFWQGTASP
ncbi:unnamed protein product [Polarella glacialis]|uniref:Ubiquitin-like domain-containing protein n=1 Tax=Polarella glacialis TaxID=89957 RepID=A0A813E3J5_POLGL|nr:unnamed protein product [Polarella glacialis]CAE8669501.1 unnamed protein product [Polarella glacialis]